MRHDTIRHFLTPSPVRGWLWLRFPGKAIRHNSTLFDRLEPPWVGFPARPWYLQKPAKATPVLASFCITECAPKMRHDRIRHLLTPSPVRGWHWLRFSERPFDTIRHFLTPIEAWLRFYLGSNPFSTILARFSAYASVNSTCRTIRRNNKGPYITSSTWSKS